MNKFILALLAFFFTTNMSYGTPQVRAPEFPKDLTWFNTDKKLQLADFRGKMVLLDFWTYCCINCMHVIPDLKKLEAKYPNDLVVIGVHSGKFDAEHDDDNIRQAVLRYEITHPVLNDKEMTVWDAYTVRAWPTFVLIDPQGYILGSTSGEGIYAALDPILQSTIADYHAKNLIKSTNTNLMEPEKNISAAMPMSFPGKIIADAANQRLIVSDSNHNQILVTSLDGKILHRIGAGQAGYKDGDFATAQFFRPQGLALNRNVIYVADTENHAIRKIDLTTQMVTTLAGTGQQANFGASGGIGKTAALNSPWDLVTLQNQLYIAMAGSHQIWRMDLATNRLSIFAGSGAENIVDGAATQAALAQPSGITSDGQKLYFADSEVSALRQINTTGSVSVSTLIGSGLFDFGDKDGAAAQALLQHPLGVAYANAGVYVADTYNSKIKFYDLKTNTIKTLLAGLHQPSGLAILNKTLYIADTNAHVIVALDLATGNSKPLNIL